MFKNPDATSWDVEASLRLPLESQACEPCQRGSDIAHRSCRAFDRGRIDDAPLERHRNKEAVDA